MNILAIDQGTSSTKAVVVDADGRALSEANVPLTPVYFDPGGAEQDPRQLFDSVLSAGRRAIREADAPVGALALANQGETVLAWDPETGEPLSEAVGWQDRRSTGICAALDEHADWIADSTGLVLDAYFSAPKLRWLRDNVTERGVVTTSDTWLVHNLTGEFVTDVATASRSLLMDLDDLTWDEQLLEVFGLGGERMPRLVDCDEVVGSTDAFGSRLDVVGLITDQPAALLGQGCFDAGQAKCTFGTGAFLLTNVGETPTRSDAGLATSVAWRIDGEVRYYLDAQIYTAASAVRWLHEIGLLADPTRLDDSIDDDASKDVYCVPAFAGLAAPWWRSDATATFSGITLATGRSGLVGALVRGLAAQVAELMDLVIGTLGQEIRQLRTDGGLARSTALMQALADLSQTPVDAAEDPHATVMGVAALARLGLDQTDLAALRKVDRPYRRHRPSWAQEDAAAYRDRWRRLAAASLPRPAERP